MKNKFLFQGIVFLSLGMFLSISSYIIENKDSYDYDSEIDSQHIMNDDFLSKHEIVQSDPEVLVAESDVIKENLANHDLNETPAISSVFEKVLSDEKVLAEDIPDLKATSLNFVKNQELHQKSDVNKTAPHEIKNQREKPPSFNKYYVANFSIKTNLYNDARRNGIPVKIINSLIKIYENKINFKSDLKPDDVVKIVIDKIKAEIVFANIETKKSTRNALYRYTSRDGFTSFYEENGKGISMKMFQEPVPGARISSRFGMRIHPVKKILKRHFGTDFAAPTGTKILAAASGTVVSSGYSKGYGKFVLLQHKNGFKTLYGHMSNFAKNIRKYAKINSGDTLGYVGKTGMATGPHLHFEIIKNGIKINPEKAKILSTCFFVPKAEMNDFHNYKKKINHIIKSSSKV